MEYEEIENVWKEFDKRLDSLEELDKNAVREFLNKKHKKKLVRFKFNNAFVFITLPFIYFYLVYPIQNINIKTIFGLILVLSTLLYIVYVHIMAFRIFYSMNITDNTILNLAKKVTKLKRLLFPKNRVSIVLILNILGFYGFILIGYGEILSRNILFLSILGMILIILGLIKYSKNKQYILDLEKELLEIENEK